MNTLFLDLDGVMADFDRHFPAVFGVDHREMSKKEMWKYINSTDDFFYTMPMCPGALNFYFGIEKFSPIVLTACPNSEFAKVARQKRQWVRDHLGTHVPVILTPGSETKPLYMHAPYDILIDDWGKNIVAWNEAGGVGIKHDHDHDETLKKLYEALVHEH